MITENSSERSAERLSRLLVLWFDRTKGTPWLGALEVDDGRVIRGQAHGRGGRVLQLAIEGGDGLDPARFASTLMDGLASSPAPDGAFLTFHADGSTSWRSGDPV